MTLGHSGLCPYCAETVRPQLKEAGNIFRDTYTCPDCSKNILYCVSPGCQDYAKGGEYINDKFCPACTSAITKTTFEFGIGAATTVVGIIIGKRLDK